MDQEWQIIDTGVSSAEKNMAIDAQLLADLSVSKRPILHLYDWAQPAVTYGYFVQPENLLNIENLKNLSIELARRPTGGGVVFHLFDFAFSILIPANHPGYSVNTLQNYAYVNHFVIETIKNLIPYSSSPQLLPTETFPIEGPSKHFCMAKPTKYDVMLNGKKVGGAAQRRTCHGFLHQGTISLSIPDENVLLSVLKNEHVLTSMKQNTCALLESSSHSELSSARQHLKGLFPKVIQS
jgi:lipoate---protein ligase